MSASFWDCMGPLQQQLHRLLLLLQEEWPSAVATGLFAFGLQSLLQGLPFLLGCMRTCPSVLAFYSKHLLQLLRRPLRCSSSSSKRWLRETKLPLHQQQQKTALRLLGVQHVAAPAADTAVTCCSSSSSRQRVGGRQRTRPPMTLAVDLDETLILATRFKVSSKP